MSEVKVVLHLGAHKTATTYLQARLAKSANPLRQMQVGYVDLPAFRDSQKRAGGLRRAEPRYAMLRRRALRHEMSELIRREVAFGVNRIVFSDENILGSLTDLAGGAELYRSAGARVRAVIDALRDHDVEIAVSIRDYSSFLPSVWSHMAMRDGYRAFDQASAVPFLTGGRGWADVVQDIRSAAPDARLTFWLYEDLHHAEQEVLRALVGPVAGSAVEPIGWQAHTGFSAPAVFEIERLVETGERLAPDRLRGIARHFCKSRGYGRYSPWQTDVARQLSERYANDVRRIHHIAGVDQIGMLLDRQAA